MPRSKFPSRGRVSVDHVRGARLADPHMERCDSRHPLAGLVLRNYSHLDVPEVKAPCQRTVQTHYRKFLGGRGYQISRIFKRDPTSRKMHADFQKLFCSPHTDPVVEILALSPTLDQFGQRRASRARVLPADKSPAGAVPAHGAARGALDQLALTPSP